MEAAESRLYHFVRGQQFLRICKWRFLVIFDPFQVISVKCREYQQIQLAYLMGFWDVFSGWCQLMRVQIRCFGSTVIFVFFSCIFVLLSISSEFFINMVDMSKIQLAYALVFSAVFRYSSFWATVIVSFRAYRDPCTFSCHLSGFRGNLSISEVHFVVRRSSGV